MTLVQLADILKATDYKVAYSHFKEKTQLPYICYKETFSENFKADNRIYKKAVYVDIELYSEYKNIEMEESIELLLDNNELIWESNELFIEDEKVFQKVYEVKLI